MDDKSTDGTIIGALFMVTTDSFYKGISTNSAYVKNMLKIYSFIIRPFIGNIFSCTSFSLKSLNIILIIIVSVLSIDASKFSDNWYLLENPLNNLPSGKRFLFCTNMCSIQRIRKNRDQQILWTINLSPEYNFWK